VTPSIDFARLIGGYAGRPIASSLEAFAIAGTTRPGDRGAERGTRMAHTVWRAAYEREAQLLARAAALDLPFTALLTGSAGLLAWGAWSFAYPMIRTAARIAVLYLSNARG
jgi:hypothetical protein